MAKELSDSENVIVYTEGLSNTPNKDNKSVKNGDKKSLFNKYNQTIIDNEANNNDVFTPRIKKKILFACLFSLCVGNMMI